jgi:hypothetical protein
MSSKIMFGKGYGEVEILAPRAAHSLTSGYVLAVPFAHAFSVLRLRARLQLHLGPALARHGRLPGDQTGLAHRVR